MKMKKILLTLLTASMLITGCTSVTQSGVVGADRKQFMLVSSEAMEQSSAQAYVKTLTAARSKGELNVDPILTKRVQDIAKRLIAQTGVFREDALKWKWQVNVINEDTLNAWCMPGGKIVVYTGILPITKNEAGLAVVMGHEVAHALADHGAQRMSASTLQQIGAIAGSLALQSSKYAQYTDQFMLAYGLGSNIGVMLPFSRSNETEADAIGIQIMAIAGYDPSEAPELWKRMSAKKNGASTSSLLSTHPSDESRIKNLTQLVPKARAEAAKFGVTSFK